MGQVIVRNLDDGVIETLKTRARVHGHSLEQELRDVLAAAARLEPADKLAIVDEIRARMPAQKTDSADLLRADRDRR